MKAQRLVFPEKHRCELEEWDLSERLEADEVLVKNRISLISAGTELAMYNRAHRGFDEPDFMYAKYPFYPGYAAVGEVVKGERLEVGTRVFYSGQHATFQKSKVTELMVLPDTLTDEQAPFLRLLSIAMTAPHLAAAGIGEVVGVLGMGLVGNLCAQLYQILGADTVAGIDLCKERVKIAAACGIRSTLCVRDQDLGDWIGKLPAGGINLMIEATGAPQATTSALQNVSDRGRVVLLGSPRGNLNVDLYFDIHRKGTVVIGAHGRNVDASTRRRDDSLLTKWLGTERINVQPLITQRLPLSEGPSAYVGLNEKPEAYLGVLLTF